MPARFVRALSACALLGGVAAACGSDGPTRPPRDPAVAWVWSGAQTASGATVRTRLDSASTAVRLHISTDSLFGTFAETGERATASNDVATFTLSNLIPDRRYFYRVVSGRSVAAGARGAFRTLPAPGMQFSFTFAVGSCQRTGSNHAVFEDIRAADPLFWLQIGDIHYRNLAVEDVALFRAAYNNLHEQPNQAALFRSVPLVHVWDDHDGAGGNDTDGSRPGWAAARAAFRESVPHYALPAGPAGAIYHSFVVGRVRFIISDLRSERSPATHPDDASKTMFGAAQKQHFKFQLQLARSNGEFIVWVSTVPWIGPRTVNADHWGGYDTERQEIAAYIDSIGVAGQMLVLTGDMHATAIDSGVNNAWGGFPSFNAGPIDQDANTKGGPYTLGPFTNGTQGGQFGLVTISDDGATTIEVTFSGRRGAAEIPGAHHQFTRTLALPLN